MRGNAVKSILIVDDKPEYTKLYRRFLESTGHYRVFTENRGSHVVATVREHRPDLIVMDILMPDMLGCDVAAELREDPALANIKVIFVTAMLQQHEVNKANEPIGGQRIIAKPITRKDLVLAIEQALA